MKISIKEKDKTTANIKQFHTDTLLWKEVGLISNKRMISVNKGILCPYKPSSHWSAGHGIYFFFFFAHQPHYETKEKEKRMKSPNTKWCQVSLDRCFYFLFK